MILLMEVPRCLETACGADTIFVGVCVTVVKQLLTSRDSHPPRAIPAAPRNMNHTTSRLLSGWNDVGRTRVSTTKQGDAPSSRRQTPNRESDRERENTHSERGMSHKRRRGAGSRDPGCCMSRYWNGSSRLRSMLITKFGGANTLAKQTDVSPSFRP